jgi:hypothetical protein
MRLYFQLSIFESISMIKERMNPRLISRQGDHSPFQEDEIRRGYERAGDPDAFPTLGRGDAKAKKMAERFALKAEVKRFLKECTAKGGACTTASLRDAFIAFRGRVEISPVTFGRAVAAETGIRRETPFGIPTYRGFHIKKKKNEKGCQSRRAVAETNLETDQGVVHSQKIATLMTQEIQKPDILCGSWNLEPPF